jgi:hypothetical protein
LVNHWNHLTLRVYDEIHARPAHNALL